jgi:hypothetical protein
MDWALEFAPPMPAQLIATLSGLARHADKKGYGAYPSVARLAAYTCKSERSVQRDLKELRKLGLIRLGDQAKAAHLPEGKRPDVYDLALENAVPNGRAAKDEATLASRVTLTSSRRRGGRKKPSSDDFGAPRTGDVHVTPDADVTPDVDVADGVTSTSQEGRRPRHPNQKKNLSTEGGSAGAAQNNGSSSNGLHPLPDDFALNDAMRRWSLNTFGPGLDVDHETKQFISHFRAEGVRKKSWPDAWQKWMRRSAQYASERQQRPHLRAVGQTPEERGVF